MSRQTEAVGWVSNENTSPSAKRHRISTTLVPTDARDTDQLSVVLAGTLVHADETGLPGAGAGLNRDTCVGTVTNMRLPSRRMTAVLWPVRVFLGGPERTELSVSQKSNSPEIRGASVWLYHIMLTKVPLINLTLKIYALTSNTYVAESRPFEIMRHALLRTFRWEVTL